MYDWMDTPIPREGSLVVVEPRHSSDRSHQDSGGHFQGSRQGRGSVQVVVGGGGVARRRRLCLVDMTYSRGQPLFKYLNYQVLNQAPMVGPSTNCCVFTYHVINALLCIIFSALCSSRRALCNSTNIYSNYQMLCKHMGGHTHIMVHY